MFCIIAIFLFLTTVSSYASPEQDKIFVESYKKAFEEKDESVLVNFLYTKGADAEVLEFYKMMINSEIGNRISNIELRELSAEEIKKATSVIPSLGEGNLKLPVTPSKKLIIKIKKSDANGTSTSSSESFVAEVNGSLLILVPVPDHKSK